MLAPVVLFVYNRYEHTKRTVEALAQNYLAKETLLYIFSDGPKSEKDFDSIYKVRGFLDSLGSIKDNFKDVVIEHAPSNKGLANSVIYGVTKIIETHKKVIVLEDDLLVTPDFLNFMNDSLNFYYNEKSIWSISGFNIPIKMPRSYNHDVYLSLRSSSWGWATWIDRWNTITWEESDYLQYIKQKKKLKAFNLGGRDLSRMLIAQINNEIDSWAVKWCFNQFLQKKYTIYPVKSKVNNIGTDGSGTHGYIDYQKIYRTHAQEYQQFLSLPQLNKKILKRFRNHYLSFYAYLIIRIKSTVKNAIR